MSIMILKVDLPSFHSSNLVNVKGLPSLHLAYLSPIEKADYMSLFLNFLLLVIGLSGTNYIYSSSIGISSI